MKMPNLSDLIMSISDLKKDLSKVVSDKLTKVIVKNNAPVSIIMPYDKYLSLNENNLNLKGIVNSTGEDITLSNGVQFKVLVETINEESGKEGIEIKTYVKMKTSGEYKLYHTLGLGAINVSQTLTNEEIVKMYEESMSEEKWLR